MGETFHTSVTARLAAVLMIALAGCASPDSTTYSSRDVGQVIESSRGRVVASRPVDIASSEQSGLGAATGGVVGGIAGSTIGKGKGQSLATAAGILVGVLVGSMLEQQMRGGSGTEYTVEMDDGRVVTIVQKEKPGEAPIPNGQDVAVQYGGDYTRITPIDAGGQAQTAAASGGYPNQYPNAAPASGGASSYPSDYPAYPPAGQTAGGATVASAPSGAGAPVRAGDSEWRNPDLEPSGATADNLSGGAYDPDAGGAPIYIPGPSNAN